MYKLLSLLLLFTTLSHSQEKGQYNDSDLPMEEVIAYGIRPGPELWKISKGENVLWILGTLSPLPKRMKWQSSLVEAVIEDSQALLLPPTAKADIGFFKGLSLATSAIGIKKNPDKKKLKDVIPETDYQRWLVLKNKYLGHDKGIEKTRPIFAATELFDKALKKTGLTYNTKVEKKIRKLAKKNKLELIEPSITFDLNKPKKAIKKFKKSNLSDLTCFRKTLDRIEMDLSNMRFRANAWANGDIELIKTLKFPNQYKACTQAMIENDIAKDMGVNDIPKHLRKKWLEAAHQALNENKSTFAYLPISRLMGEDNIIDVFATNGYTIKVPK